MLCHCASSCSSHHLCGENLDWKISAYSALLGSVPMCIFAWYGHGIAGDVCGVLCSAERCDISDFIQVFAVMY